MSRRTRACILAAVLASAPATGYAEDLTDIQSILTEQVVTTASTAAQSTSATPALSTTISADDLRLHGIRTLAEAISFLGLGLATGDPLRTPDLGARGVLFEHDDGKHVLLLIDGHAVNDPLYGTARFDEGAGIPMDLVDHIEVVVGPGSVLYGSNAMMGVINVITKDASTHRGAHARVEWEPGRSERAAVSGGLLFPLFGTRSELTAGVEVARRFGPSLTFADQSFVDAIGVSSFHYQFDPNNPRRDVWGGTVDRAYHAESPSGYVRLRSGDFEAIVMASAHRFGFPYATTSEPVVFDDDHSRQLERALRVDLKHQATLSSLVQLSSRAYADGYDRQRRLDLPGQFCLVPSRYCRYDDVGKARWLGLEERLSLNWLHDGRLVTLIGFDARERFVSAKQDFLDPDTGRYFGPTTGHIDQSSLLLAPYVQQTYSPTPWLDLNAGARMDADSRLSPVLSPRGAIAARPFERTTLRAIYSQAFRAPTWAETVLANHLVAPSQDVQPESVRSIEGTIEQRFGTHRMTFGVFRSWWDSLVESTALSNEELNRLQAAHVMPQIVGSTLTQYRNVSSIDNYGWNAGYEGTLAHGKARFGANATAAIARVRDSERAVLVASPTVFGNAHFSYVPGGYFPSPGLAVSVLGRRAADREAKTGESLPSAPPMADLRLTLSGPLPGLRGLSYYANADYITASRSPYTAGPDLPTFITAGREALVPHPERLPVDQVSVFFGLRLDLFTEREAP